MTVLDRYTYVAQETATSYIPTYRTALVGDSERKVTIYTDEAELRKLSADGQLRCVNRHCKKPRMVYRHGSWMQPHFAHLDEECGHPGESPEHDATKRYLARVLAEYNPGAKIEVEKFVDPTRPDVLIKLPSELPREILYPWEVAIEVQCSGMSDEYMQQKLESNKANDIHTLYIFDAQSGLFLRSVNHYPGRRAVTKPEDFWNFI
jgi:competence CoiA-like predicted nuclease